MPKRTLIPFIVLIVCALFYPGNHFLYSLEIMNPQFFANDPPLVSLKYPIPAIKKGAKMPTLSAESAYIVEKNTFTVLLEKNADTQRLPASTTKMVSAIAALDLFSINDVVTVKEATDEGQIMGLVPEERISIENLLYGLLVHSANDAAYALAYASPGGFKGFVSQMNIVAKRIGMKHSIFKNPAGLDEPKQVVTAHDLALAARALLLNPIFKRMVSVKEITVLDEDFRFTHELTNVNELLGTVEGLGGIKTGYTEEAGENLVSLYKTPYSGHEYIIVVMKSEDRFGDTEKLTNWLTYNIDYIDP